MRNYLIEAPALTGVYTEMARIKGLSFDDSIEMRQFNTTGKVYFSKENGTKLSFNRGIIQFRELMELLRNYWKWEPFHRCPTDVYVSDNKKGDRFVELYSFDKGYPSRKVMNMTIYKNGSVKLSEPSVTVSDLVLMLETAIPDLWDKVDDWLWEYE